SSVFSSFFFQAEDGIRDRNVTGVQTCALPICPGSQTPATRCMRSLEQRGLGREPPLGRGEPLLRLGLLPDEPQLVAQQELQRRLDRKSTRLNSSHVSISYAVFCLKKKKIK